MDIGVENLPINIRAYMNKHRKMKFFLCLSFSATAFGRTLFNQIHEHKDTAPNSIAGSKILNQYKQAFDFKMNPVNGLISMEEWLKQASQATIVCNMTYFKNDFFHPTNLTSICEYLVRPERQKGVQYSPRELAVIPMYFWTGLSDFSKFKYNSNHAFCFPESCIKIIDTKREHEVVLKIADQVPLATQIGVHEDHKAYFGLGMAEWTFCNCEGKALGTVKSLKEAAQVHKQIILVPNAEKKTVGFNENAKISYDDESHTESESESEDDGDSEMSSDEGESEDEGDSEMSSDETIE
jgi:hypothetical protein